MMKMIQNIRLGVLVITIWGDFVHAAIMDGLLRVLIAMAMSMFVLTAYLADPETVVVSIPLCG